MHTRNKINLQYGLACWFSEVGRGYPRNLLGAGIFWCEERVLLAGQGRHSRARKQWKTYDKTVENVILKHWKTYCFGLDGVSEGRSPPKLCREPAGRPKWSQMLQETEASYPPLHPRTVFAGAGPQGVSEALPHTMGSPPSSA